MSDNEKDLKHTVQGNFKKVEQVSERLDFVRGQGWIQFKNGAYTIVREYFKLDPNTALEQKMNVMEPVQKAVLPDLALSLSVFSFSALSAAISALIFSAK